MDRTGKPVAASEPPSLAVYGPTGIPKLLYTSAEAAEALGVSVETIRNLVYKGTLPHIEGLDRFVHIPISALEEFIKQETRRYGHGYQQK